MSDKMAIALLDASHKIDEQRTRIAALEQENKELRAALEACRLPHERAEYDCWFACGKSENCCDDSKDRTVCDCGADAWNARIDAALAAGK